MAVNIRPKTVRRLVILIVILTLIVSASAAIWISHQKGKERQLANDRRIGIEAYSKSDYPLALDRLKNYVAAYPDDYDALFAEKLSALVFYVGATGLLPDEVEAKAQSADVLAGKYPDLAFSKDEKEGTFFEVGDTISPGRSARIGSTSAWTISPPQTRRGSGG